MAVPGQTGLFTDQQPIVGGTPDAVPSDLDVLSATHCQSLYVCDQKNAVHCTSRRSENGCLGSWTFLKNVQAFPSVLYHLAIDAFVAIIVLCSFPIRYAFQLDGDVEGEVLWRDFRGGQRT